MLSDLLPFYDELNIVQTVTVFIKYSRSYSIEIIKDKAGNMNDPSLQLEGNKSVTVQLQSLKLQILRLFRARSSLTFRQL